MDSYYMALVLQAENLYEIPHDHMRIRNRLNAYLGRVPTQMDIKNTQLLFFKRKELLRSLMYMKGDLTVDQAKKYFPKGIKLIYIRDFVVRRNYFKKYGEQKFFERYYPTFYQMWQHRTFWNSHYLNYV